MKEEKIYIVGAGIAGLIAALELERAGFYPIILEASDRVGGRMATDEVDGFLLDRGFQVLNTAYPEAKKYLDFQALNLKTFDPGAIIFGEKETFIISDPLRNPLKMVAMAFSKVGSLVDKFKLLRLSSRLKKKSNEDIFSSESIPTLQYLKSYGFSDRILENFFIPFFQGIFLEKQLNTSSRMFEFIFKMFSLGQAAVPEKGMGQIPEMLRSQLSQTQIYFNQPVKEVRGNVILLKNGDQLEADRILLATQPDQVMKQLQGQYAKPRSVRNVYFSLQKSFMARPIIGLIPGDRLINSMVFMDDVSKAYSPEDRSLLSVTVLESELSDDELISQVQEELFKITGIGAEFFQWIRSYTISHALPYVDDVAYSIPYSACRITDQVYLAGDYLLHGSINAAMTAGRIAATAISQSYQPTV